jgi:pimeloyl-ACP methyl ester carboxylesterase
MSLSNSRRVSRFIRARDGLRLHYFDYPAPSSVAPIICLPGLARSAEDFDPLAHALTASGRRLLSLDYRGRGESQWDPDWTHYALDVEEDDIFNVLIESSIERAVFIGTSRGGIHIMRLAQKRPGLVCAAVLNDIGPQIELAGLLRIKRYVGKLPPLASIAEATALIRMTAAGQFSNVSAQEWEAYARLTFVEKEGRVVLRYDPELAHALDSVQPGEPPDDFWPAFDALTSVPVLGIRGSNSDILSPECVAEMARRHPNFQSLTVEGQGHAPLLLDRPTIDAIVDFVRRCP